MTSPLRGIDDGATRHDNTKSSVICHNGCTAARSSRASAVIPTVLINNKPATVLGTVGSHGNPVIAGSGTVLIGG